MSAAGGRLKPVGCKNARPTKGPCRAAGRARPSSWQPHPRLRRRPRQALGWWPGPATRPFLPVRRGAVCGCQWLGANAARLASAAELRSPPGPRDMQRQPLSQPFSKYCTMPPRLAVAVPQHPVECAPSADPHAPLPHTLAPRPHTSPSCLHPIAPHHLPACMRYGCMHCTALYRIRRPSTWTWSARARPPRMTMGRSRRAQSTTPRGALTTSPTLTSAR